MKNTSLFYIKFQVLRRYFCEDTATSFFISCVTSVFISADIVFTTFYNFIQHYLEKIFVPNLPFSTDSPPHPKPHPLNGQNLLNVKKKSLSIFLKMPSQNFFFKILLTKFCKYFSKVPTTYSLVFFSEHITWTAILTGNFDNFQGMEKSKSTESFCRSILAIYANDWSIFWCLLLLCLFFFWEIPKYVHQHIGTTT